VCRRSCYIAKYSSAQCLNYRQVGGWLIEGCHGKRLGAIISRPILGGLEWLHELLPVATSIAHFVDSTNPVFAESETQQVEAAAQSFGVQLEFLNASDLNGIERAFVDPPMKRTNALFVSADGFLLTHSDRIVALASRNAVPAAYGWSQAVKLGGLMSYGTNFGSAWRQAGIYTGRILNGERPAVLPVQQVTKVDLFINQVTARALGIMVPLLLLGRADEVIE
jgi:putative ABC transport system substrate-binding protein